MSSRRTLPPLLSRRGGGTASRPLPAWVRIAVVVLLSITALTPIFILRSFRPKRQNEERPLGEGGLRSDPVRPPEALTQPSPSRLPELTTDRLSAAFVSVISNERYVDGAMVLAWTLREKSQLVRSGGAGLELLVSGELSSDSVTRLRIAGWDRVTFVTDLSILTPKAGLRGTYNKLHVFNMTRYERVAYYDSDVLVIQNPDGMVKTRLRNSSHLGAICYGAPDYYFKTGMMLVMPDAVVFAHLLHLLKTDVSFRGLQGRDGLLLRHYFRKRCIGIDAVYSQYRRPWQHIRGVKVFHFRGEFKPWYNRLKLPPMRDRYPPEFGPAYTLWWEAYERMHVALWAGEPTPPGWPKWEDPPSENVWMIRHTEMSYVHPLPSVAARRANLTLPGLVLLHGEERESCSTVCQRKGSGCVERALLFTSVQSYEALNLHFTCSNPPDPLNAVYGGPVAPYFGKKGRCWWDPLYNTSSASLPACDAVPLEDEVRRLCPCASRGGVGTAVVPFTGWETPPERVVFKGEKSKK